MKVQTDQSAPYTTVPAARMAMVKMAELKAEMDQSVFSACAKTALTIEAVVQLSTTPQLSALDIGARQEGV